MRAASLTATAGWRPAAMLVAAIATAAASALMPAGPAAAQPAPATDLGIELLGPTPQDPTGFRVGAVARVRLDGGDPIERYALRFRAPAGVAILAATVRPNLGLSRLTVHCDVDRATRTEATCDVPAGNGVGETLASVEVANVGLPADSTATLTATVSSAATDPDPADDEVTVALVLPHDPVPITAGHLVVTEPDVAVVGDATLQLNWAVRNDGPAPIDALEVTVATGAGTAFGAVTLAPGGSTDATACRVDGPRTRARCPAAATLAPTGVAVVRAEVVNFGLDPSATATVEAAAAMELTDWAPGDARRGTTVRFGGEPITLRLGGLDATAVVTALADLPAGLPLAGLDVTLTNRGPVPLDRPSWSADVPSGVFMAVAGSGRIAPAAGAPTCNAGDTGTTATCTLGGALEPGASAAARLVLVNTGLAAGATERLTWWAAAGPTPTADGTAGGTGDGGDGVVGSTLVSFAAPAVPLVASTPSAALRVLSGTAAPAGATPGAAATTTLRWTALSLGPWPAPASPPPCSCRPAWRSGGPPSPPSMGAARWAPGRTARASPAWPRHRCPRGPSWRWWWRWPAGPRSPPSCSCARRCPIRIRATIAGW
ncbi:MAG: hypothetical protein R2755_11465 [Acidimicrobiales bacterium]